jgi:stress response protein YsnF
MAQTVIGMFDNSSEAQQAVEKLVSSGISRDRIDVTDKSSSSSSGSTGSSYSSTGSDSSTTRDHDDDHHDNAITRFFKNLFGDDDDDADKYSKVASRAKCIVTVHAQSSEEAEDAADILDDNGAVDVNERASEYGYGSTSNTGTTGTGDYTGTSDRTSNNESKKIPVIKENIEIGKREVESGGARVRSRIVERPVEESIRLRQERVNVERNPVDRPASDSDFSNFEEKDIEMVERSEVPVVNKQARVVEEVSLNKEVEEKKETVKDTVRDTEVDVDNLDKGDVRNRSTGGSSSGSGSSAGSGSNI